MRASHGSSRRGNRPSSAWFALFGVAAVLGVVIATLVLSGQDGVTPPSTGDALSWATLARVKHLRASGRIEHRFDKTIASLDGTIVQLSGFMIPYDLEATHARFLLAASPRTCFGCWIPGPEGRVEIIAASPFGDTYDRIVVSGRFSVLRDGSESLYYRITDAVRVAEKRG